MTDQADRTRAFQQPVVVRRCPDCRGLVGPKHMEVCPGPRQVVAPWPVEPVAECDCPAGWHLSGCPELGDAA